MFRQIKVKLTGCAPGLLMHNPQIANPKNPHCKEIKKYSKKRNKSERDYELISELEFMGGLYLNQKGKPVIPSRMLEACAVAGAKKYKLGKAFKAAVMVEEDAILVFSGPKDLGARAKNQSCFSYDGVVVQGKRVWRTRPWFQEWSCTPTFLVDDSVNDDQFIQALQVAGREAGLGDWRPKYGRFDVEVIQ